MSPKIFLTLIFFPLTISAIPNAALAEVSWFQSEEAKCNGSGQVRAALESGDFFKNFVSTTVNDAISGHVHAIVSKRVVNDIEKPRYYETVNLTADKAAILSSIVSKQADAVDVPWFASELYPRLIGLFNGGVGSLLSDGAFSYLFKKLDAAADSYSRLAHDIVDGGTLHQVIQMGRTKDDGRTYTMLLDVYSVSIGNTQRDYVLSSCVYPTEVKVSEFKTVAASGNKILRFDGNDWEQLDIESGRLDSIDFSFVGQDMEFYYFNEMVDGAVFNEFRISMFGGAYQLKTGGSWATLYPITTSQ